jgi:FixJ family two-component response regulator
MREESARVFVVDDDPAIREALDSLLRSVGLGVQTFASACDFLESKRPDLPSCPLIVIVARVRSRSTYHEHV